MDSNERSDPEIQTSVLRNLNMQVQRAIKHPQLNNDLSEALDAFLRELTVNNHYLRNGIFTMKFAEIGIFLQSTAMLYCKQVDMLWEDTLHYHVKLCTYNQLSTPQNEIEANRITERINRNKRRKVVRELVQNSVLSQNLLDDLERSSKVLKACETITKNDDLRKAWKNVNTPVSIESTDSRALTSFQFSTHQSVHLCTGQKLGNYDDLFLNRITPYLGSFSNLESEDTAEKCNQDFVLQRYLKRKGITYKKFCLSKLEEEFNLFRKRIFQIDSFFPVQAVSVSVSNALIANVTHPLMSEHDHDEVATTMMQDLLAKEGQGFAGRIKKCSERISEVDSAFQDEIFSDTESACNTPIFAFHQRNVDSGLELQDPLPNHTLSSSVSENNENVSVNQITEDDSEENIGTDDIPQDDILNSTIIDRVSSIETSGYCSANEGIQTEDESDTDTNENLAPANLTTVTVLKPLPQKEKQIVKTQKRKLKIIDDDDDVSPVKQRRTAKFKWLTSTTATLKRFERFFLQHYIAEEDEVDPNNEPDFEDISEDEEDEGNNVLTVGELEIATITQNKFEDFFRQHYLPQEEEGPYLQDEDNNDLTYDEIDNASQEESDESCEVPVHSTSAQESNTCVSIVSNELLCDSANVTANSASVSVATQVVPSESTEASLNIPVSTGTSELAESNDSSSYCTNCNPTIVNQEVPVNAVDIEARNRIRAVNEWKSFIEPKLKKMEKSSDFDIHHYGSQIMDAIPEGRNLAFKDLGAGKSASDVCKLFLASLQLANTYNIEINSCEPGQLANDSMSFKLLTRERYHEYLEDFEAPSEHSFRARLDRVIATCPTNLIHSTPRASTSRNSSSRTHLD